MEQFLLLVTREGMGQGPRDLQTILVINFFKKMLDENILPSALFFYAEGIKLNTRGSVIEDLLKELEKRGTRILSCLTCLNYYSLKEDLATGSVSQMSDLVQLIGLSNKVVTI